MSKLIKHKWNEIKFHEWKCPKCTCIKRKIPTFNGYIYWYFRSGIQLTGLPECRSLFHNDKI